MSEVRSLSIGACLLAALVVACAPVPRQSQGVPQKDAAAPVVAGAGEPATTAPAQSPTPAIKQPEPATAAAPPVAPDAAAAPDSSGPPVPNPARPTVIPPARPAAPSSAAPPSAPKVTAAPPAKSPNPPSLDLKSLETRLKETKAIGVFTKLTLKNQVDDLLDAFRAYYKGQAKSTLVDLRRAYDMLVLKVIALIQDADAPLASAIAASREAIWGILSDPAKFATV